MRLIIAPRSTAAQHRPAEWGRLRCETINPPGRQLARKSAECPWRQLGGPSWLTFLGHMRDSLWSMDLFRCESAMLRTHWVLVVMDQYTRRIIGFGVHAGMVDGVALCRMFNRAIRGQRRMPNFLSSDNDPLYRFHQWQANVRILDVTEIKSVPYVPLSHPFVERLIGTVRHEARIERLAQHHQH